MGRGRGPILVVASDSELREALSELLRSDGFDVVDRASVMDALGYLRGEHAMPCLLVIDMFLVAGVEWERLDDVTRIATRDDVPVVVMSGLLHLDVPHGATLVQKPIPMTELLAVIRTTARASQPDPAI